MLYFHVLHIINLLKMNLASGNWWLEAYIGPGAMLVSSKVTCKKQTTTVKQNKAPCLGEWLVLLRSCGVSSPQACPQSLQNVAQPCCLLWMRPPGLGTLQRSFADESRRTSPAELPHKQGTNNAKMIGRLLGLASTRWLAAAVGCWTGRKTLWWQERPKAPLPFRLPTFISEIQETNKAH